MSIENYCEVVKQIYENPFAKVTGLTVQDFYNLQNHVADCEVCTKLTDEILEKYKDVPHDPNMNDGRYN
jgi:3-hydroxy-3-methylglutaryl CoA synthase